MKYLLLSGVGAATFGSLAVGLIATPAPEVSSDEVTPLTSQLISLGLLILPFLWVSWAAGWAYLNVELWAHRPYLGYLETLCSVNDKHLTLNRDVIEREIYGSRPRTRYLPTSHVQLDILVALFSVVLSVVSVVASGWEMHRVSDTIMGSVASGFVSVLWGILLCVLYVSVFVIKVILSDRIRRRLGAAG